MSAPGSPGLYANKHSRRARGWRFGLVAFASACAYLGTLLHEQVAYAYLPGWASLRRASGISLRAYTTLQEDTVEGLNTEALAEELQADTWLHDSFLVKTLEEAGATNVQVSPAHAGVRNIAFNMDMWIPWKNVEVVEGWGEEGSEKKPSDHQEALPAPQRGGGMPVQGTIRSVKQHDELSVELTFSMGQPVLNRMSPKLQLALKPTGKDKSISVWLGAFIEWTKPCHFMIRKPMDTGFLAGLRRYGQAILTELRRRASK